MRLAAALVLVLLLAIAGGIVVRSSYGFADQDRDAVSAPASMQHRAGTDDLGRDRLLRTAAALLLGFAGAAAAASIASACAVSLGVAAAFAAAPLSRSLLYLCDLFLTLPWMFLLMIVRSVLPLNLQPMHSALLTFLFLGILGAPVFVRINYTRALGVRRAGWLMHGIAAGLAPVRLLRVHVLPHLRPILLTQFLTYLPICLIAEANLGALGLGVSQPLPSWGSLLLEMQHSAALAQTRWIYLPMGLLVLVLFALEMSLFEVDA